MSEATGSTAAGRMWSRSETAGYLNVPVRTVAQWAYQGTGPKFYRLGKHARYRPEDVEAWLEKHAEWADR
jgi:excisionase family DNA binding protein